MSNLSSDTLFHFTSSLGALKSILKEGIRFGLFVEKLPSGKRAYTIRGISFCNIPLSMANEHVDWYGRYAVGLKRTALRELGVSPVFYVHSQSKATSWRSIDDKDLLSNPFLPYVKQYYGKQFHRVSGEYRYKKFYDEKEWRLFNGTPSLTRYASVSELEAIQQREDAVVPQEKPLVLTLDMIEYIILDDPKDFSVFNDFLKSSFQEQREDYLTKILYYTQIKKDF